MTKAPSRYRRKPTSHGSRPIDSHFMIVFITTKMKPVAAIHSMPRTTGAGLESISTSGSIVAQEFWNNGPRHGNAQRALRNRGQGGAHRGARGQPRAGRGHAAAG